MGVPFSFAFFAAGLIGMAALPTLPGCGRPAEGSPLFPLEKGHAWTYRVTTELENEAPQSRELTLARKGDEATAARFTVLPDGSVSNVNTLPKKLVQRL